MAFANTGERRARFWSTHQLVAFPSRRVTFLRCRKTYLFKIIGANRASSKIILKSQIREVRLGLLGGMWPRRRQHPQAHLSTRKTLARVMIDSILRLSSNHIDTIPKVRTGTPRSSSYRSVQRLTLSNQKMRLQFKRPIESLYLHCLSSQVKHPLQKR